MAFVSFATFREASIALEEMAKVVINGRKVIAEFHRRAPATPKVTSTNQIPTHATTILPSPKQTSKNQLKPQPQPHPPPPPPIEQNVILDDNENCSPLNHSPVDNANQNNNNNNIPSIDDQSTPKQLDKRAQFFANRDHERKTKRQTQHASVERDRERDRVLESEFRNLLIDYAKGSIRNPNVPKLVTEDDAENEDGDASGDVAPESSGTEAKSDDDSAVKDESAVTEESEGNNGDEQAEDENEKNKTSSNAAKSPAANAKTIVKRAGCDEVQDLVFDSTLTSYERRMVHSICDELNLGHISRFDNDGRRILRVTRNPTRAAEWAKEASSVMNNHKAAMENKHNHHTPSSGSSIKQPSQNISTSVNSMSASPSATSTSVNNNGGGPTKKLNFYRPRDVDGGENGGILPPSYKVYTPKRQPSGPPRDATNVGFATRIKFHKDNSDKKSPTSTKKANKKQQQSPTGSGSSKSSNGHSNNGGGGKGTTKSKKQSKKQSSLNPSLPSFSPMNGLGMGNNGNGL